MLKTEEIRVRDPFVLVENDSYYLFVSLLGRNGRRGTQIAVADQPEGPFLPLTDHAVTPAQQSCIDGTLY